MADSIVRLRVDSQEYDNKLKRAAEGLNRYIEGCRKAGGTLEHVDDGVKEFTQELGKMGTVAGGAKGKLGEMTKAFTDLTMQFNAMSEAEKRGQFGKALSAGLDELKQRIISTKKELADINSSLSGGATGGGGLFGGDKLSGMLQVFGGNVMTKLAGAGMGFVSELGDMVKQGIELARAGEGVRIAFERLGRGDLLDGLRQATHGTVTDLELMKAAVKFNDFKLPVEELGTMLAFAQQKAKDTGQSVDYMVDSIVTGLGRKSLMILDNLGLSAAEIRDKMKETGDMTKAVGEIIREQMAKAGDYVETAADRATQANVSLQNKMEELGRKFAPVEEASNQLWTSIKIGILDIVGGPLADLLNGLTRAGQLRNELKNIGSDERVNSDISKLKGSNFKEQVYTAMLNKYSREEQKALDNYKKAQRGGMGSIAIWENRYLAQKTMREDFQSRGREVLNGSNSKNTPTTPTNTITPGGGTTTPVPVKIEGFDTSKASLAAAKGVDTMPSVWGMLDEKGRKQLIGTGAKAFDLGKDITEKDYKKLPGYKEDSGENKLVKELKNTSGAIGTLTGGINSITSGIKAMGFDLPDEIDGMINGITGLAQIISGVGTIIELFSTTSEAANTVAVNANTVAIGGLITALEMNTGTNLIPFFANGGVVPHAQNGLNVVGGTHYSGDVTPILANAGEVVLNHAQVQTLASNLQGGGLQGMKIQGVVTGQQLRLLLVNTNRQDGGTGLNFTLG